MRRSPMANITIKSLHTGEEMRGAKDDLIRQVQQAEKKAFAKREAMDFSNELRKRNMDLVIIADDDGTYTPAVPRLVAYMVLVHLKAGNAVFLHKICVLEDYRRRGIARMILESQAERLKKQGSSKIQLWVDEGNLPARGLYKVLGFEEVSKINDYYNVGRTGIQMHWGLDRWKCDPAE